MRMPRLRSELWPIAVELNDQHFLSAIRGYPIHVCRHIRRWQRKSKSQLFFFHFYCALARFVPHPKICSPLFSFEHRTTSMESLQVLVAIGALAVEDDGV